MKLFKAITNDYHKLMAGKSKDSLNFENCSTIYSYSNKDIKQMDTTDKYIYILKNELISTYIDEIIGTSTFYILTDEQYKECGFNVKRLSFDFYGTTAYWYLILAVNKMMSVDEFKHVKFLYMPDKDFVESIIDRELIKFKEVGIDNIE